MGRTPDIELLDNERVLFDAIVAAESDRSQFATMCDSIGALTKLLLQRQAIPKERLRYFTDPELNIGGHGKSMQQIFEQNGTSGDAILRHGNFAKYFWYFVCGPDLPSTMKAGYIAAITDCGAVTSGDVSDLCKQARQLTRAYRLPGSHASEELFKLAIEHGVDVYYARMIRDDVRSIKAA